MLLEFPNLPSVNIVTGTYWAHDSADIIPAAPDPIINTCLFESIGFFKATTLISIFNWIIQVMNIFDLIYIYSIEKLLNNKEGVNLFLCFLKQKLKGGKIGYRCI